MHKQDTATLNQAALTRRMKELALRQSWLAMKINVTPLTVNRWMNGKVRRISRDNLALLASALDCDPQSLAIADEADIEATRDEQSLAAKLLVARDSQQLFISTGQLDKYESLIKAVMHPRMPLTDLAEIYSALTFAAARQGKIQDARRYARLKLEYALRAGDPAKEISARTHLVTLDAEEGRLLMARRGMLDLLSSAESQGVTPGTSIPMINLVQVYRLLGEPAKGLVFAARAIRYLQTLADTDWSRSYAFGNAAAAALECGAFALAHGLKQVEIRLSGMKHSPAEQAENKLLLLAAESLQSPAVGLDALPALQREYLTSKRFTDGHSILPALLLRRAGRLDEAERYLGQLAEHPARGIYEAPAIDREAARLAVAQGDMALAQERLDSANAAYLRLAMRRQVQNDPGLELGAQFKCPAKLLAELDSLRASEATA